MARAKGRPAPDDGSGAAPPTPGDAAAADGEDVEELEPTRVAPDVWVDQRGRRYFDLGKARVAVRKIAAGEA